MQKGILTIAFDDGYLETYKRAITYIDKYGIKSTLSVPAGLIGKTCEKRPVVSWKDLENMVKNGHEIASHTLQHTKLKIKNQKSKIEIRNLKFEIEESKRILDDKLAADISSFVYPYMGELPDKPIQDIVKNNYSSARISKNYPVFNSLPIKNPYNLNGFCVMKSHSIDFLNKQIEKALEEELWLIEVFHLVGRKNTKSAHRNAPYRFFMHIDDFKTHIDFILSKKIEIFTQGEVIKDCAYKSV